jgi:inner membrane protein
VVAQALLPIALTALVTAFARIRRPRAAAPDDPPVSVPWLLALSYIGVYSHVLFDYLNNYGVRLLAPLDWRWFYGDAVFIVDPWLWAALGAGVWLSRRSGLTRPARSALGFAACYAVIMLASAHAARGAVIDSWRAIRGEAPQSLMVGPVPAIPSAHEVIVDSGDRYETGRFSWVTGALDIDPMSTPKQSDRPEVALVRDRPDVKAFLAWSRFPYWDVQKGSKGVRITVRDMRFGGRFGVSTWISHR